jgi:HlyD family secretion protein
MKCIGSHRLSAAAAALSVLTLAATSLFAQNPPAASLADKPGVVISAYTQPSDRRQLSFNGRGIILKEEVKEGDVVKKGQPLLRQDDRMDRAQWDALKIQDSELQVEYAKKDLGYKQVKLKRVQQMHADNVATQLELEEAQLDVDRAATQVQLAGQDRLQKRFEGQAKGVQVDWMTITSPIDGVVEKIVNRVGEATNPEPDRPSIIVVQNDPLWVIMNLPNKQVQQIKADDVFQVRNSDQDQWRDAKVQFISPTADPRSFKRLVRLEFANPEGVAGGQEIQVKLPEKLSAAANTGVATIGGAK